MVYSIDAFFLVVRDFNDTSYAIDRLTESNEYLASDPANVERLLELDPDVLDYIGEVEATVELKMREGRQA